MEPELALAMPAAGALAVALLRAHRRAALTAGAVLGLAGLAALLVTLPDTVTNPLPGQLDVPGPSQALLVAATAAVAVIIVLAPRPADRLALSIAALAGLAGLTALAAAPNAILMALTLLGLVVGQAALEGRRSLAERLQGPVLAAILLTAGQLLAAGPTSSTSTRLAALALGLGLVAALGLFPFVQRLDPAEPVSTSSLVWLGFVGPVLAISFTQRVAPLIDPSAGAVYGSVLIGLGILNLVAGGLGAWKIGADIAAWRYSFLAEWGLVLVGLGILQPAGRQAAFLLLLSLALVRMPLYLWARPAILRREEPSSAPLNLVLIALLAGVAPFAGFSARLLLLRSATELYWPLALVLALGLLLWVAHCVRLAATLGRPRGRAAAATWLAVATSLAIGLLPGQLLSAAGL